MLSAFSEFERVLIKERQREGIEIAKAKGIYKGRKPSLNVDQASELRALVAAGMRKVKVARDFGITRQTLYQYLKK